MAYSRGVSERFANRPANDAWTELGERQYDLQWSRFRQKFGFRPGTDPASWPAIAEPEPSVTFDLSIISDGARRGAAYDAINAEALRAFLWSLAGVPELVALDWQHPGYLFRPAVQALGWQPEWKIPVYPDGDYFAFMTPDFTDGTFGHPWEQTLCVFGARLLDSLGRSLATWLPTKRRNQVSTDLGRP